MRFAHVTNCFGLVEANFKRNLENSLAIVLARAA